MCRQIVASIGLGSAAGTHSAKREDIEPAPGSIAEDRLLWALSGQIDIRAALLILHIGLTDTSVVLRRSNSYLSGEGVSANTNTRKELEMSTLFNRLNEAARKRAAYHRTVSELENLPLDTKLDLNIYSDDIPRIAADAVYGR